MDKLDRIGSGFLPGIIRRHTPSLQKNPSDRDSNNPKKSIMDAIPDHIRNHGIAMLGEGAGTFMFFFLAFSGTQVANTQTTDSHPNATDLPQGPNPSALMYIALVFGFSLAVNAWVFFRVSGGLFNPAVTLALCLIGAVPWVRGGLVLISQMVAGIAAAGIVSALFPGPLAVRTTLGPGVSIVQGLFIEMFLTAQLIFTIIMLASEKHKATFIAPIGIGLSLFVAELSGVYYTGGSLNPARSFGPDVILHKFDGYHWIYWLGPALGALLASSFFGVIKFFDYQTANPGQDFDDLEAQAFDPKHDDPTVRPIVNTSRSNRRLGSGGSEANDYVPDHTASGPSKVTNGDSHAVGAKP